MCIRDRVSIDQPPGIRAAFQSLAARRGSLHEAAHEIIECLGQVVWQAQRDRTLPDSAAYIECIRKRVGV